ncbi:MAG TPA: peptidoglycan-binding domain-containing protein [Casimicrobiaceae bacterium]
MTADAQNDRCRGGSLVRGPATASALRRFQQTSGLPQTGELDSRTVSALGIS